MKRLRSLSDLEGVHRALLTQQEKQQLVAKQQKHKQLAQQKQQQHTQEERDLFLKHMKGVTRLPPSEQAKIQLQRFQHTTLLQQTKRLPHTKPNSKPNHGYLNQEPLLELMSDEQDSLSDDYEINHFLEPDDPNAYQRNGISHDTLKKLRKGQPPCQAQLDLHGQHTEQARQSVTVFLKTCLSNHFRCVCIIHGKGLSSKHNTPILKEKVKRWLIQNPHVLAFCAAPNHLGGTGALFILLKNKHSL